ncbi:glycogenin-1-like isoform X2 [Hemitrygon akajei]|uniref:glycogenin-1-like isoform X2 n=1 Tax=Hemitrygon akajei TaxID=2704970 RepID=UPI003BF9F928
MSDQAFVTLATNDLYGKGALVLGTSLRNHKTTRKLVILVTPQVTDNMRSVLQRVFDEVIVVDVLDSKDSAHLAMIKRPELGVTFTKLHCWALTQYSKCIFMDADTLVLCNIDELFEREELSAAPDPGWPDCFNTGVFVYRPSIETYNELLRFSTEKGSFDGGDQGLLNSFFSSWATADINKHLPFIYNLSSVAIYSYLPAFKQYGPNAKVVHFLGNIKPWNYSYNSKTRCVTGGVHSGSSVVHTEFIRMWWDILTTSIQPMLIEYNISKNISPDKQESCLVYSLAFTCGLPFCRKEEKLSEAISHLSVSPPAPAAPMISSEERRKNWEQGQADFMGVDSFQNIQKKLDTYLN